MSEMLCSKAWNTQLTLENQKHFILHAGNGKGHWVSLHKIAIKKEYKAMSKSHPFY